MDDKELETRTMELANRLKEGLNQNRVTVVFNDHTEMIGDK